MDMLIIELGNSTNKDYKFDELQGINLCRLIYEPGRKRKNFCPGAVKMSGTKAKKCFHLFTC